MVFDGKSFSIKGAASCSRLLSGSLVINAPGARQSDFGAGHNLIRVVLRDTNRLVVVSVGIRLDAGRGFNDVSDDMWATKADDTYTINGRMDSDDGTPGSHQFTIEVACPYVGKEMVTLNPPGA